MARRNKADTYRNGVADIIACARTISWHALVESDLPDGMEVEDLRAALSGLLVNGTIAASNRNGETLFVSVGTCGGPQRKAGVTHA